MKHTLQAFAQTLRPEDIKNVPQQGVGETQVQAGLQIVFAIAGAVAVLIIAIAAFRIVISRGKSEDISKARNAIIYAAIGLVISMIAFMIVAFVVDNV